MHKLVQLTPKLTINTMFIIDVVKITDTKYKLTYYRGRPLIINETQYKSLF